MNLGKETFNFISTDLNNKHIRTLYVTDFIKGIVFYCSLQLQLQFAMGNGISASAASNPLLYYGYYAQMLQGVQSHQQKLMEQLSGANLKQEDNNRLYPDHRYKRKSNSSDSTSNRPDIKPLSSSPLKNNNKNSSISHRLSSPLTPREFKPETQVCKNSYIISIIFYHLSYRIFENKSAH